MRAQVSHLALPMKDGMLLHGRIQMWHLQRFYEFAFNDGDIFLLTGGDPLVEWQVCGEVGG
jgi:hypothetical protein